MSFNDNKYRMRMSYPNLIRGSLKGYSRLEAIKTLAELLPKGYISRRVDFHQRKMVDGHRRALFEVARLWQKLDEYEKEVKERKPYSRRPRPN